MSLTTTFVPVATRNVSIFIALWLASAVCFIEPASAGILPTLFLRELVAKSEEIVVARPADAARLVGQDVKFVASEVLKGRRIVVGQTITVAHLSYYHLDDPPRSAHETRRVGRPSALGHCSSSIRNGPGVHSARSRASSSFTRPGYAC
jgi:hypothetical protein